METKIFLPGRDGTLEEGIRLAADYIKRGELAAFPTETVYGLGGDALQPTSAKKIYAAKGRPSDNPLIVHICAFDALSRIVSEIPEAAVRLAEAFWPGPLTMILPKTPEVPYETTGGLETVAVRMPVHPVALKLIEESGGYVAAPSANTSGRPSPTQAAHVFEDLNGKIPIILDGGAVGIGIESTIIDLSGEQPMILRPGYITQEMLAEIAGPVGVDPSLLKTDQTIRPKAPGMKYRHYAPKAPLSVVDGDMDAMVRVINEHVRQDKANGLICGVICAEETKHAYEADTIICIGTRKEEESIARNLYGALREMDSNNVDRIYAESFRMPHLGDAIMNRLQKAAGQDVIHV